MVRSREENTGHKRISVSCEADEKEYGACAFNRSPPPGALASNMNGTSSPTSALTLLNVDLCSPSVNTEQTLSSPKGTRTQKTKTDRTYLGVKVRMPVKDMLRDFRMAKGMDPKDIQMKENKSSQGDKKRVNLSSARRNRLKNGQTKSLEELAIIVEVLEEDLKTSTCKQSSNHLPTFTPEVENKVWVKNINQQGPPDEPPITPSYCAATKKSSVQPVGIYGSAYSQTGSFFTETKVRNTSVNRQHEVTSQYDSKEYIPYSEDIYYHSRMDWWGSPHKMGSPSYSFSGQEQWNSMTEFWPQMERDAYLLNNIYNQELFITQDEKGRTLLHRAVDEGKRSLVYVIARRMADLNKLDSKDAEGRTSLHLAAQKNLHFMVADLISLGANINERDQYGKTCLHLSAEHGHIKVLEVLKSYMKNGTYIDLEARDANGLSALQLASVALKNIMRDLEKSLTVDQAKVHSLHKEQMMETLKCLLQMECNLQSLVNQHLPALRNEEIELCCL